MVHRMLDVGNSIQPCNDDRLAWENLKELVRSETVSDNPNDKQKKALEDLPVRLCELFNLTSPSLIKIIDIKDHNSLVYGKWKAIRENAPTVLLYAHYDVVRADGTWDEPEKSEADPATHLSMNNEWSDLSEHNRAWCQLCLYFKFAGST